MAGDRKMYGDWSAHETNSLFAEWPTPADTVAGFGGNPDRVNHRQWQRSSQNRQQETPR
jgi:hypothetical protein